jgi:hypothetical protein
MSDSFPPTGDFGWVVCAPKLGHLSDCAFLVQNLGAKDIDDLRLRTDIKRRAQIDGCAFSQALIWAKSG